MADDGTGMERRKFLERGVMAAGLVWTTPVIRSVGRLGARGTPPPSSASSSTPTVSTYTFAGSFPDTTYTVNAGGPGCFGFVTFDFTADLTTLGVSNGSVEFCVGNLGSDIFPILSGGSFALSNADGSISGQISGGQVGPQIVSGFSTALHTDISVAGGTGLFGGATGTAVIDGVLLITDQMTGDISGTFEVPS
jgi:hypothetical protein